MTAFGREPMAFEDNVHGCSGLYGLFRSKDVLVQHTCQHTSAYSYDLIFEKTLSKAKAILQRQDTNEIAATFGTSPRPHVACRAKGASTRLRPEYSPQYLPRHKGFSWTI